jgi:Protein of unknown function (DUF1549)/Protein of unknown function (DUF1553)/Planctomycete cytochrome C
MEHREFHRSAGGRLIAGLVALYFATGLARAGEPAAEVPQFERDIHPLLKTYCWRCHGGEGFEANLDLRSLPNVLLGGKSGLALEPGSAEKSLLYRKIASGDMPPGDALKPTEAHRATIKAWIEGGAPGRYTGGPLSESDSPPLTDDDRAWWAFQKPVRHPVPAVRGIERVANPIDAFLLARLEARGLSFAKMADRQTLIRRVFLDLIGLPPTPAEIDEFLTDDSPDAWERLIDRLLESPHYGERWGRHWLDAAGYVDTLGSDNDAAIIALRDGIWRYRDYVVQSFNRDKGYDRFLLEQLAGDELVDWRQTPDLTPEAREALIATGYLRQSADDTNQKELNTADIRHRVLYETVQTFSTSVLGLTMHCAQCHSHKFDPISHADYYRLLALFAPAYNVQNWKTSQERFVADVGPTQQQEIDRHNAGLDTQVAELNGQIAGLRAPVRQKLVDTRLTALPEQIREDVRQAIATPAAQRGPVQTYLAEKFEPALTVKPEEVEAALDEPVRRDIAERNGKIAALQQTRRAYGRIQALWDVETNPKAYLYRRGNYETPGARVSPGLPEVLAEQIPPPALIPAEGGKTSGFRTGLAKWLTHPEHPLTARVVVNRLWQQYFGRGIVSTPDNFGRSGALPSHGELLDWLATEFVRNGWKFKALHRLILTSHAYRQSSVPSDALYSTPDDGHAPGTASAATATGAGAARGGAEATLVAGSPETIDSENRLLWRMPLRRVESEIIRDMVLAVSGNLDHTAGGPPVPIKPLPDGLVVVESQNLPPGSTPWRRSLYLVSRRNYQPTELSVFDQPLVATSCTQRTSSAVALQSLTMLNGTFMTEQGERFARRVLALEPVDERKQIELAFRLALSRAPAAEEVELGLDLLSRHKNRTKGAAEGAAPVAAEEALIHLCHMLLNTSEFLYIP